MSEKNEKDAAGKALYMEFRKENYTYQVILVPALIGMDNQLTAPATITRRISTWHPRKNWSVSKGLHISREGWVRDPDGKITIAPDALDKVITSQGVNSKFILDNLASKGYELHKKPFFVEITYKDLETVKSGKNSNDLYRRITRSRDAFAYSPELVEPVVEA